MQLEEALEQLDSIHEQLTKGEIYPGFSIVGAALVGILGLCAAGLQPSILPAPSDREWVVYWLVVAVLGVLLGTTSAVRAFFYRESELERRRTWRVLRQFAPALVAGAVLPLVLVPRCPGVVPLLPGLWAVCFGLGLISAAPYLPTGIDAVARAYFLVGLVLLVLPVPSPEALGWAVGGTFGCGQIASAVALYRHRRRTAHA